MYDLSEILGMLNLLNYLRVEIKDTQDTHHFPSWFPGEVAQEPEDFDLRL